jgi:hypothetical protein
MDQELEIAHKCLAQLANLDYNARHRVIDWLIRRALTPGVSPLPKTQEASNE